MATLPRQLRVRLDGPKLAFATSGNGTTLDRWRTLWLEAGHCLVGPDEPADLAVFLHATKSRDAIRRTRTAEPGLPIVVAIGGTDLYGVPRDDAALRAGLEPADRIVVLQPLARARIEADLRDRVRVIPQACLLAEDFEPVPRPTDRFRFVVLANLRSEKDPELVGRALEQVDPELPVEVLHLGFALDPKLERSIERISRERPRYHWLGGRPRAGALDVLSSAHAHVVTSRIEGAPSALSEALRLGVPTLGTRIDACVGLLGAHWPGLFDAGDAGALARLIERVVREREFLVALRAQAQLRAHAVHPANERRLWAQLFAELAG